MRAVIYARISRDAAGEGLGVERQTTDCQTLADARGWQVVDTLVDNDRSAYTGRPRPAYQRLLAMLKTGDVDVVIAWHPDRLHRSPRELEDFIDTLEAAGATVETVTAGAVDLSTAAGRMTARVVGAVARHESEHRSERVRRAHLQLARDGKPGSGGTRPFGYEPDMVTIREDEAAHVRAAVAKVIAGATLRSIRQEWEAAGVAPVNAQRWQPSSVRRLLTSPRIAGLREHHGTIVGPAIWPAIITVDDHHRIVAAVTARAGTRRPSRRYLLTGGIGRCGLCGHQLYARPRAGGRRAYVCATDHGGCGRIRALADPLEAWVADAVLARAADARFTPATDPAGERATVLDELADLAERKDRLAADFYTTGDLTDARQFRAATDALDQALAGVRARLAALDQQTVPVDGLAERWPTLSMDDRRAAVAALVDRVTVGPAIRGLNRFDPRRVSVTWRA